MKVIKALEILKELSNGEKVTDLGYIDEAIAELEARQAPKTCDGCKWVRNHQVKSMFCGYCIRQKHLSDKYEPKG